MKMSRFVAVAALACAVTLTGQHAYAAHGDRDVNPSDLILTDLTTAGGLEAYVDKLDVIADIGEGD
ncbi:hypothetical protein [Streptomyces sp. H27-S2]|uniref:hypothetical protein n=1 Tax=Streptomyces antarcticus TaxID=2996458 RepID=UPI002271A510|nr:hypothetical protein [Streptomyces sp. H27-S2]MCY0950463.1 hypothetical protein [Streptomyces sp. H27-S2]